MGRFINPFTDFGFKFLFGREVEKELLIDFLNDLLVGEHVITDIQDVYKRQSPYCIADKLQISEGTVHTLKKFAYRKPVSYTHL